MDSLGIAVLVCQFILFAGVVVCALMHFLGKRSWNTVSIAAAAFIWVALVVLRYPVQTHPIDVFERHLVTFIEALKYFSFSKSFAPLADALVTESVSQYYFMEIVLSVAAPACSAVLVLALLQQSGRLRPVLMFWRPVYYFSELNEKSFTLAKNISTVKRGGTDSFFKPLLVFCKVDNRDTGDSLQFRNEARKLDAIFYDDPIYALRLFDPWSREVKVFLIDRDEHANMSNLLKLKNWIISEGQEDRNAHRTDSDVLVFTTEASAELLFDKLLEEIKSSRIRFLKKRVSQDQIAAYIQENKKHLIKSAKQSQNTHPSIDEIIRELALRDIVEEDFRKEESRVNLHLINETHLVTQNLLLEHPLYEAVSPDSQTDHISVLVVGCGYLGTQFLKTAMLCGMMDSYSFQIQVIDQQAAALEEQFFHDHPFLDQPSKVLKNRPDGKRPAIAPVFHQAPVCTKAFDDILKEHCAECNYIVVTTGDDHLNMITAQYLQRWYARQAVTNGSSNTPLLFAAVRNPERFSMLKTLETKQFHLFANNMELFSVEGLVNRRLDAAAAMFNNSYVKKADFRNLLLWDPEIRQDSKRWLLQTSLMTQQSNQIVALHSLYKLHDLEHFYRCKPLSKENDTPESKFRRYAELMQHRGDALYDLEHRRWALFHALNGWDLYPHETIFALLKDHPEMVKQNRKVHRNEAAQLHGCMIPTQQLPAFAERLSNAHVNPKPDFQGNDRAMCVASLFAWLILEVEPQAAEAIRAECLKHTDQNSPKITTQNMLDIIEKTVRRQKPSAPAL